MRQNVQSVEHSFELGRSRITPMIDKLLILPIAACAYAIIVSPLIIYTCSPTDTLCLMGARPENRIFWPAMAVIAVFLALQNRSRLRRLSVAPHIICLVAYLAFAGASVTWAFRPEISSIRFAQQMMIVTSIFLPALLAARSADMMLGLFLCFACASILNIVIISGGGPPILPKHATWGHAGYFTTKNLLGQCAAIALLLSLHEMLYAGRRRIGGIIVAIIAMSLLLLSNSKTSLGIALLVPVLAACTLFPGFLFSRKRTRISPAVILLAIPICYIILSNVSGFSMNRISYALYGDSTFTNRTFIWDFARSEIARKPLLGWGYQSFWLVGPDGPSYTDARSWVKAMPNAHNGYMDTMLEMGYVGLTLLIVFLLATLHTIGRVADRDPSRAWLLLSLTLFVIISNFLESTWMRAFNLLWVVFVMVCAEIARYWQPIRPGGPARYKRRSSAGPLLGSAAGAGFNQPGVRPTRMAIAADDRPK